MEVRHEDTGWEELYECWQDEGEASTFERIEENACQRWRVMQQPRDDYPRFLLVSAAAGTETGNERPADWQPRRGYSIENRAAGIRIEEREKGIRLKMVRPPLDEDTVTLEE